MYAMAGTTVHAVKSVQSVGTVPCDVSNCSSTGTKNSKLVSKRERDGVTIGYVMSRYTEHKESQLDVSVFVCSLLY